MRIPFDFETIVDDLHDGLYLVDRNRVITYWNKAAEQITGYNSEEVIGRTCADNILLHVDSTGKELCKEMCPLAATIEDGKPLEAEVYFQHKSGHRLPVIIRVTPLKNEQGEIMGGIELFSENTYCDALRIKLTEMQKLALLDPLTELPNRRHLDSKKPPIRRPRVQCKDRGVAQVFDSRPGMWQIKQHVRDETNLNPLFFTQSEHLSYLRVEGPNR